MYCNVPSFGQLVGVGVTVTVTVVVIVRSSGDAVSTHETNNSSTTISDMKENVKTVF